MHLNDFVSVKPGDFIDFVGYHHTRTVMEQSLLN